MQNLNLLLEVFLFVSFIWSLLCNENKKRIERRQLSWLIWISRLELQFERRPARNAPIKRLEITLSWVASAWRWPAYRRKNWSQLISFNVRRLLQKKNYQNAQNFRLATEDFFSEKLQSNYLTSSCIDFGDFFFLSCRKQNIMPLTAFELIFLLLNFVFFLREL